MREPEYFQPLQKIPNEIVHVPWHKRLSKRVRDCEHDFTFIDREEHLTYDDAFLYCPKCDTQLLIHADSLVAAHKMLSVKQKQEVAGKITNAVEALAVATEASEAKAEKELAEAAPEIKRLYDKAMKAIDKAAKNGELSVKLHDPVFQMYAWSIRDGRPLVLIKLKEQLELEGGFFVREELTSTVSWHSYHVDYLEIYWGHADGIEEDER